ncbi:unnamed protein product [marine sediment metagenome]|uniref:Uncharacterized protein n=1 Tax=marine sediment metagenome TaxID=412755 RepID=X1B9V6_9ZZZZ
MPKETLKALVVVIVKKTADEQPKYFAFWAGQFWFEGDVEGKWLKIEVPMGMALAAAGQDGAATVAVEA